MKNKEFSRRQFISTAGMAGVAATILPSVSRAAQGLGFASGNAIVPYVQQPLPYAYAALEPSIDAMTMEIHYGKHAAAYAKNLSEAVAAEGVNASSTPLEQLLGNISKYSAKMRNNGGGHYNHELFWKSMAAPNAGGTPSSGLSQALVRDFGSADAFKTQFTDAGKNRFGSGWAWLVKTPGGKLAVGSLPNQDNPLMDVVDLKGTPLLGLDVWEHAYYLKYQNRRPDYINAWWNVVNWNAVNDRFDHA